MIFFPANQADLFAQILVRHVPRYLKFGENVEFVDKRIASGKFDGVTIAKGDIADDQLVSLTPNATTSRHRKCRLA